MGAPPVNPLCDLCYGLTPTMDCFADFIYIYIDHIDSMVLYMHSFKITNYALHYIKTAPSNYYEIDRPLNHNTRI